MFTNHRVAQKLYAHLPHHWVAFSRIQPSAWKVAALCTAAKPRGIHVDGLSNNALKHLAAAVEGSKTPTAVGVLVAQGDMHGVMGSERYGEGRVAATGHASDHENGMAVGVRRR